MHQLLRRLYPICRSLTGEGVRETLRILGEHVPLECFEVASGTPAFDWTVPPEWNIREAFLLDPEGRKVVDFRDHNLHVVSYSEPVDRELELDELQAHLHSLPELPEAIPYVYSYYRRDWGFCLSHHQRTALKPGRYRAYIDSDLKPGHLTYAELLLPGEESREVLVSSYVCHPSMANNELSGPVVATFLAAWLRERPRRYSYRFVWAPETIGSLVYLSRNLERLKQRVIAAFNLTCIGDERAYSYLPSRVGHSLSDRVARNVLRFHAGTFNTYTYWRDRGSDERQYCSPGVDLPMVTLARSLFRKYPEYHTSLDDCRLVTEEGLQGSLQLLQRCVETLEANRVYRATVPGEPQLGKRGLYQEDALTRRTLASPGDLINLLAYADGTHDLIEISNLIETPVWDLARAALRLQEEGLLQVV